MVITTDIDPNTNAPIEIPDEPKILATMQLIFRPDGTRNYLTDITNDSYLNYNGRIGIEVGSSRGQSSAWWRCTSDTRTRSSSPAAAAAPG